MGNQVEYVQNGIVVYTSTVTPSFPLTADCSIYTTSASFNSGKYITSAGFDSASSVSTNAETVDMSRGLSTYLTVSGGTVTKTGSSNTWDAGAFGSKTISGGGYGIEFMPSQTNGYLMVGLTTTGTTTHSYDTIDFAIYPRNDGSLYVYESGSSRGSMGTYTQYDVQQVRVNTNGAVEYVRSGTVVYTSTVTPTFPLAADLSIYTLNAAINSLKYITSAGFDGDPCSGLSGYSQTCTFASTVWDSTISDEARYTVGCEMLVATGGSNCGTWCSNAGRSCIRAQDNAGGCSIESSHSHQSTANNGCDQNWGDQICVCT